MDTNNSKAPLCFDDDNNGEREYDSPVNLTGELDLNVFILGRVTREEGIHCDLGVQVSREEEVGREGRDRWIGASIKRTDHVE